VADASAIAQADRVARRRQHNKAAPSTPQQPTEEAAMTTDSPVHSWIRFWLKRNDHEFEEEAKRQRELDQTVIETGLPRSVLETAPGSIWTATSATSSRSARFSISSIRDGTTVRKPVSSS
jgi:hypothetical protein